MNNTIRLVAILLLITPSVAAQQPRYAAKLLVSINDGTFKDVNTISKDGKTFPVKEGKTIAYMKISTDVYDVDDDRTTFIKNSGPVLLCFEGAWKNGKKEGLFNVYVIDSLDHQLRYKIWGQQYKNDRLNGEWRQYALSGMLLSSQTYENDSLKGIAREYGIDGKMINEREFLASGREYVEHQFYRNGKIARTITVRNAIRNGLSRGYYEDGKVMEEVHFEDDKFHGTRKYFYPNGQLWIEQVYKKGLFWTVVSNFNEKGERRDAGTLRDGNGTIIYYNEDGSIRTVSTFVNGVEQ